MGKHARKLVVTLHVVASVGWMSQAVALLALLVAILAVDGAQAPAAWAAEYLDAHVLALAANTSAFTGLVLAAATPWGFVRHWWVATKLVLTVGQIYAGIFVLSGALRGIEASGGGGPVLEVALGAGLMAGALAFQTWLSVAKPWGRTPAARPGDRGATAPARVFVLGVGAPVADIVLGTWLGRPLPVCSLMVLAVLLGRGGLVRIRRGAGPGRRGARTPRAAAGRVAAGRVAAGRVAAGRAAGDRRGEQAVDGPPSGQRSAAVSSSRP